jgi:hypothetical protein
LPWRIFKGVIFLPNKTVKIKTTLEFDYAEQCYEAIGEEHTGGVVSN